MSSLSRRNVLVAGAVAAVPALLVRSVMAETKGHAMGIDAELATWMLTDGAKQIWVSKPVLEKANSPEVKAFAAAEIKEHEDLKAKIMAKGVKPLVMVGEPGKSKAEHGTSAAVLDFKNELAVQCIASTNAEQEQKSGKEYDMMYVGTQLHEHMGLKDTVTVAMKHASDDMKPLLQEAMGVIDTHIATLKGLKMKMKNA